MVSTTRESLPGLVRIAVLVKSSRTISPLVLETDEDVGKKKETQDSHGNVLLCLSVESNLMFLGFTRTAWSILFYSLWMIFEPYTTKRPLAFVSSYSVSSQGLLFFIYYYSMTIQQTFPPPLFEYAQGLKALPVLEPRRTSIWKSGNVLGWGVSFSFFLSLLKYDETQWNWATCFSAIYERQVICKIVHWI